MNCEYIIDAIMDRISDFLTEEEELNEILNKLKEYDCDIYEEIDDKLTSKRWLELRNDIYAMIKVIKEEEEI